MSYALQLMNLLNIYSLLAQLLGCSGINAYNGGVFLGATKINQFCFLRLGQVLLFWGFDKKLWTSLMYVVFWSIWRARNRIIFEKAKPNWELEIYQVRLCLAYWAKAWCPDLPFSMNYIAQNLHQVRQWWGDHSNHRRR